MTVETLSSITGIVLSLAFSYVPGLKGWYEGLGGEWKRLVMAGLLLAVACGIYGLSCLALFDVKVTCDTAGALKLVELFILALVSNQAAYLISPKFK